MEECDSRFQFGQPLIGRKAGKPDHQRDIVPGVGTGLGIPSLRRFSHRSIVSECDLPVAGRMWRGVRPYIMQQLLQMRSLSALFPEAGLWSQRRFADPILDSAVSIQGGTFRGNVFLDCNHSHHKRRTSTPHQTSAARQAERCSGAPFRCSGDNILNLFRYDAYIPRDDSIVAFGRTSPHSTSRRQTLQQKCSSPMMTIA